MKQIALPNGKVLVAVYAVNVMLHNGEKVLLRDYNPQDEEDSSPSTPASPRKP